MSARSSSARRGNLLLTILVIVSTAVIFLILAILALLSLRTSDVEQAGILGDESAVARSEGPVLPPEAEPANMSADLGEPAGHLQNVYTGSPSTETDIAVIVHEEFSSLYGTQGQIPSNIEVTDPVTEEVYTFTCSDNGEYVTCTADRDMVVYIV